MIISTNSASREGMIGTFNSLLADIDKFASQKSTLSKSKKLNEQEISKLNKVKICRLLVQEELAVLNIASKERWEKMRNKSIELAETTHDALL